MLKLHEQKIKIRTRATGFSATRKDLSHTRQTGLDEPRYLGRTPAAPHPHLGTVPGLGLSCILGPHNMSGL